MVTRGFSIGLCNVLALCVLVVSGEIKVVNNGYEGVTIEISSYVAENDDMLGRLETFFTDASATLFRATRNRLYFREFIIVIPEEWQTKENYEHALNSEVNTAHFTIDKPSPGWGDRPYARTYQECGYGGRYIHFTPNFVLNDEALQRFGPREKVVVHEWGHFRWGVFDEYPTGGEYTNFYRSGGKWLPTKCSEEVYGKIINVSDWRQPCVFDVTTGPGDQCRFIPRSQGNEAVSSLMFAPSLDTVVEFCDHPDTAPTRLKHNRLAPNKQNLLCHQHSIWEVLRNHTDFDIANETLPDNTNIKPTFRYIQAHPKRRVLVLDVSGSMAGRPLEFLRQAASSFIVSSVESGSKLGIVQFNDTASVLSHLQELSSEQNRSELVDALPTAASGRTSIGAGLLTGLEILNNSSDGLSGSIVLITDGYDNEAPHIEEVKPTLTEKGIVVHSFAFGQDVDEKIANLSRETGGKIFYYSGQAISTALMDGLNAIVTSENGISSKANVPQTILTEAGEVTSENPMVSTFYIDTTVGKETSVTIAFTEPVEIRLQGPTTVYNSAEHKEHDGYNETSKIIKMVIPGEADEGLWSFNISTEAAQSHVTVNVQSKTRKPGMDVIQVTSWIPEQEHIVFNPNVRFGIYAEVLRGKAPVLNAQVLATIERPLSTPLELLLYDNGVGIDIIKDDGIYAAAVMAPDLLGDGRYNIKVNVVGSEGQVKVVVGGGRTVSGASEIWSSSSSTLSTQTASLENFQRVTTAGEFLIKGFNASSAGEFPDKMAPARITDLRVTSFDLDSLRVKLQWTSVGDDMERGTATEYQIHTSEDFDELMFQTDQASKISEEKILKGSLSQPRPSGNLEEIELQIQPLEENTTMLLGVMAVDESGNRGEMSNLLTLSLAREMSIPQYYEAKNKDKDEGITSMIYLAIAVPLTVIVLAAVVLCIIVLVYRRKTRKSGTSQQVPKHLYRM